MRCVFGVEIFTAIEFIHEAGIFHRDISPKNIMIDINGRGRLIDFDLARATSETGARLAVRTVSC
jgi:eukaryotic-like serine/threonine-protein kinase